MFIISILKYILKLYYFIKYTNIPYPLRQVSRDKSSGESPGKNPEKLGKFARHPTT